MTWDASFCLPAETPPTIDLIFVRWPGLPWQDLCPVLLGEAEAGFWTPLFCSPYLFRGRLREMQYLLMDLTSGCGFLCRPGKVWPWSWGGCYVPLIPHPRKNTQATVPEGTVDWRGKPQTFRTGCSFWLDTRPFPHSLSPFSPHSPGFFQVIQSFNKYLLNTDYLPRCAGQTGNNPFLVGLNPIGGRRAIIKKLIECIMSGGDKCYKNMK